VAPRRGRRGQAAVADRRAKLALSRSYTPPGSHPPRAGS
jgi:hypothetical protein